jgi:hypothetical protein
MRGSTGPRSHQPINIAATQASIATPRTKASACAPHTGPVVMPQGPENDDCAANPDVGVPRFVIMRRRVSRRRPITGAESKAPAGISWLRLCVIGEVEIEAAAQPADADVNNAFRPVRHKSVDPSAAGHWRANRI